MDIHKNISLKKWNTWKVGGCADFFYAPTTEAELLQSLKWAKESLLSVNVLGGGTNVLVSDEGVRGLTIHTIKLQTIRVWEEDNVFYVAALAGAAKADVMQIFLKHKLAPAIFLCGLPGAVAGGVVMNAGISVSSLPEESLFPAASSFPKKQESSSLPREFRDIVKWVKILRGDKLICIKGEDIIWEYRASKAWEPGVIYEVCMAWPKQTIDNIQSLIQQMALRRMRTQPLQSASSGSVFKNPKGDKAGRLIEECGLKGYRIGGAMVSKKHANFIVNTGEATAKDIHFLIQHIQQIVEEQKGILLEPEIKYLGTW